MLKKIFFGIQITDAQTIKKLRQYAGSCLEGGTLTPFPEEGLHLTLRVIHEPSNAAIILCRQIADLLQYSARRIALTGMGSLLGDGTILAVTPEQEDLPWLQSLVDQIDGWLKHSHVEPDRTYDPPRFHVSLGRVTSNPSTFPRVAKGIVPIFTAVESIELLTAHPEHPRTYIQAMPQALAAPSS